VTVKEDYITFVGIIDGILVKVTSSDLDTVTAGDTYLLTGQITPPDRNTFPSGFNYQNYLLSKRIKYVTYNPDLSYVKSGHSIYILKENVKNYINENLPLSKDYVKTFVLADKNDIDQDLQEDIRKLGISHLFAVSGFHIALLVLTLDRILKKSIRKDIIRQIIISSFLLVFLLLTSFSPSVLRAALMYIFLVLNKKLKLSLSTIDILSIIFLLIMICNPFSHLNVGFVLSFLVTLFILLSLNILKNKQSIHALFLVGTISFLSTIPIIMNLNHEINILTIVFNVLFVLLMSYIVLPLNYISFILPFLDYLNNEINTIYNQLITIASVFDFMIIRGSFTHPIYIMMYYSLLLSFLMNIEIGKKVMKIVVVFVLFMIITLNSTHFEPLKKVVFLDVKGDSTLITDHFNHCNILIDTGEKDEYHSVLHYIQSRNIKKIDYVIITHYHSDHYGELETINEHVSIETLITNKNVSDYHTQPFSCGSIVINIYPMSYTSNNENNNSIILSLLIEDDHYLFTGDIEEERELEFINRYHIDVDYLKVPHHGSNTSSSEEFIDCIKPEEVIVSARRNYRIAHPNEDVVRLYRSKGIEVQITKNEGTIEYIYLFDKQYKKSYSP
jgi:competence protein ComEC